jgi:UDP-glucose 4-epimerase
VSDVQGSSALVVGGAGFVGRNLVASLLRGGASRIVVLDNFLSSEWSENLELPGVEVIRGSCSNDDILASLRDEFDFAFHLATYHGNQNSISRPLADHANNTLTTLKLFDRLTSFRRLQAVVYSSAGCTVAEKTFAEPRPTREDDPVSLHLDSPYQISKIVGEMYANFYRSQHGLPVVIARFQNVYGPGEMLGSGQWRGTPETVWRNVVPNFVFRALTGMPITIFGDGSTSRDFIFVEDVTRGLALLGVEGRAGEVYNLASGIETTIAELIGAIERRVGPLEVIRLPQRPWDRSGRRLGSTEKAEKDLGFRAEVSFEDGIDRTIEWTRTNLEHIRKLVAGHANELAAYASAHNS